MRGWCGYGLVGVVCAVPFRCWAAAMMLGLCGYRGVGSAFGASSPRECLTWVFGGGSGERSGVTFTSTHGPSCIFLCDMGL